MALLKQSQHGIEYQQYRDDRSFDIFA